MLSYTLVVLIIHTIILKCMYTFYFYGNITYLFNIFSSMFIALIYFHLNVKVKLFIYQGSTWGIYSLWRKLGYLVYV